MIYSNGGKVKIKGTTACCMADTGMVVLALVDQMYDTFSEEACRRLVDRFTELIRKGIDDIFEEKEKGNAKSKESKEK